MNPFQHIRLPVVAAPMFLISNPKMVVECCKAGIIGTLPALNQRTTEGFEEWVVKIKEELAEFEKLTEEKAAPFGVNLIVHPNNKRLVHDLRIVIKHRIPLVITSLGAVDTLVKEIHGYGGLVFHDIIKKRHAEKAAEAGVDGLILVSAGAGGHGGTLNPIPFIKEVRSFFKGTILLSGCIADGKDVASALAMGADLAYIGTRFINTEESPASDEYKKMINEAGSSDVVYTAVISGVNANFLEASLSQNGIKPEQYVQVSKIDFEHELDVGNKDVKAWKTIWSAGQGVASVHDVLPIAVLVKRMCTEFKEALVTFQFNVKNYIS